MLTGPMQSLLDQFLDIPSSTNDPDAVWSDFLNQDSPAMNDMIAGARNGDA